MTDYDVIPTNLAIRAMRDSGYKNAAYAIAELIDNSIQAGASRVELICTETSIRPQVRNTARIDQIAVLDDGSGMDSDTLRLALQFGNGTHLDDRSGIGRFGMGLPNSSISQCRRVDVWTWRDAPDSALYTYLDLAQIEEGKLREVPSPEPQPVPDFWRDAANHLGESGTLVVWSHLDRCQWRTARAVIQNSEFVIGRMYRRFLYENRCSIRLARARSDSPVPVEERFCQVNDPLYLMVPSSCPEPFAERPMFEPFGDPEDWEYRHRITYNGTQHDVIIRLTVARPEARREDQAGSKPYGKHARKNVGVSIVRAGRELEMSRSWDVEYDPTERWWGAEIEFPPALDELFGVSNNKQSAQYLSEAGNLDVDKMLKDHGGSMQKLKEELQDAGDPMYPLLEISQYLHRNLDSIRKTLKAQTKSFRAAATRQSTDQNSAESQSTRATERRKADGHSGTSDTEESLPREQRTSAIAEQLAHLGLPDEESRRLAEDAIQSGHKYVFTAAEADSPAFFSVQPRAGAIIVTLNTAHPAYRSLVEVLDTDDNEDADASDLRSKLRNAWLGLRILLAAWARYEDELSDPARTQAKDARSDWGRVARQFFESN